MSIQSEILQRLLIDRHLGELSSDAAVLLDAYLDLDSSREEEVLTIDTTLTRVRKALRTGDRTETENLPPASFLADAGAVKATSRFWNMLKYLAVAAMIVLAIRLGVREPPAGRSDRTSNRPAYIELSNQTESAPSRFWSARRWQRVRSDSPFTNRRHIQWPDPMRWPRIGDES